MKIRMFKQASFKELMLTIPECFRESGKKRKDKEKHQCKRNTSIASCMNPTRALTGEEPAIKVHTLDWN